MLVPVMAEGLALSTVVPGEEEGEEVGYCS